MGLKFVLVQEVGLFSLEVCRQVSLPSSIEPFQLYFFVVGFFFLSDTAPTIIKHVWRYNFNNFINVSFINQKGFIGLKKRAVIISKGNNEFREPKTCLSTYMHVQIIINMPIVLETWSPSTKNATHHKHNNCKLSYKHLPGSSNCTNQRNQNMIIRNFFRENHCQKRTYEYRHLGPNYHKTVSTRTNKGRKFACQCQKHANHYQKRVLITSQQT